MGLAAILRERNDLLGAEHFINRAMALAPERSVSVFASASAVNAHIRQTLGRRDDEAEPLAEAIRTAQDYNSPHMVEWLRACQARLDLGTGDLNAVRQWAQTQSGAWNETGYYPEFEEITLARFYLADQRPRAALALLNLWQARAEERGRVRSLIEIGVLQAEALWVLNQRAEAQQALCRALALAEPEGIQRTFLDEGERLLPLLDTLAATDDCAARLLAVLRAGDAATAGAASTGPLDRLTPRELEILRAIARGASNKQVADTFVLTVGTVKGHVNHILSKLGAGNRTEAVARGRELGLI
jgi:LuxR family maltose regulon positive regulatory protein